MALKSTYNGKIIYNGKPYDLTNGGTAKQLKELKAAGCKLIVETPLKKKKDDK